MILQFTFPSSVTVYGIVAVCICVRGCKISQKVMNRFQQKNFGDVGRAWPVNKSVRFW